MAFNGSGTFNQATSPVVSGTVISSTNYNSQNTDFANGLTNVICKDGQTQPTANLPMATFRHTGVGNAAARTDYAAAGQVQDGALVWCGTAGGTANALTLTPSPAIAAYAAGQVFRFTAGASPNSGATTVAVSGLTAQAVQASGSALTGGEIAAGRQYQILYDGTNFQLQAWAGTSTFLSNVTAPAFIPNGSSVPTNGVYLPATNTVGLAANSTNFLRGTSTALQFSANADGFASVPAASSIVDIIGANSSSAAIRVVATAALAGITLRRANGTMASRTALATNDIIGQITPQGFDGTNANAGAAAFRPYATENWTTSARGTAWELLTNPNGSTSGQQAQVWGASGSIAFPAISTTASAANAFLDSGASNNLLRSTSSIRYKRDVEDADPALTSKIFDLRPIWYRSKAGADNPAWGWWGFIAEEVAEVDPRLVHWAYAPEDFEEVTVGDGEEARTERRLKPGAEKVPDGVQYERLTVLMLAELKALRARVAALEAGQ